MFGGIKNNWKKSEAAVFIQNLFEGLQQQGMFPGNPAAIANKIIDKAFEGRPEIFDGSRGVRPHKVAYAAAALGMVGAEADRGGQLIVPVMMALGIILRDVEANYLAYSFSPLDKNLIETSRSIFERISSEMDGV